jgi:excisionase family DNA binding protein
MPCDTPQPGDERRVLSSSNERRGGVWGTRGAEGSPGGIPRESDGAKKSAVRWLLDVGEVALVLGIGRTKAYQMMARAELPVVRIGRLVRVPRAGLADWIEQRTITGHGSFPRL